MKINLNIIPQLPFPHAKNRGCVVSTSHPGEMELSFDAEGNMLLSGLKISVVQAESQKTILPKGSTVERELLQAGYALLNATFLDFLLDNQQLIPKTWQEKDVCIFFWGTKFRDSNGSECLRFMTWNGRSWGGDQYWPDCAWHKNYKAIVAEKP